MNYRSEARACLARAEAELKANDDQRLKYAALELRMAMEALTYDRAVAYKDEFPQSEYETWQPKKMMLVLLEIDPLADKDSTISFGKEKEYGKPAENMQLLGSERVLSMATLKKHYDALGSYLHLPTVKRFKSGELHDLRKLRSRCEEIANFIGEVLSSRVFNSTLGVFSTLDCDECGNKIRRRLRGGNNGQILAKCNECPASYIITEKGDDGVVWRPWPA